MGHNMQANTEDALNHTSYSWSMVSLLVVGASDVMVHVVVMVIVVW